VPRCCLTLDLKNDPRLIAEYKAHHDRIWPEVVRGLKDAGIEDLEIYLAGTRLCMILETADGFSFEEKVRTDAQNPVVRQWEELMSTYQQPLPDAQPGERWRLMDRIFKLSDVE